MDISSSSLAFCFATIRLLRISSNRAIRSFKSLSLSNLDALLLEFVLGTKVVIKASFFRWSSSSFFNLSFSSNPCWYSRLPWSVSEALLSSALAFFVMVGVKSLDTVPDREVEPDRLVEPVREAEELRVELLLELADNFSCSRFLASSILANDALEFRTGVLIVRLLPSRLSIDSDRIGRMLSLDVSLDDDRDALELLLPVELLLPELRELPLRLSSFG